MQGRECRGITTMRVVFRWCLDEKECGRIQSLSSKLKKSLSNMKTRTIIIDVTILIVIVIIIVVIIVTAETFQLNELLENNDRNPKQYKTKEVKSPEFLLVAKGELFRKNRTNSNFDWKSSHRKRKHRRKRALLLKRLRKSISSAVIETANCEHIELIDCDEYETHEMRCMVTATGMPCCVCSGRLKSMRKRMHEWKHW